MAVGIDTRPTVNSRLVGTSVLPQLDHRVLPGRLAEPLRRQLRGPTRNVTHPLYVGYVLRNDEDG